MASAVKQSTEARLLAAAAQHYGLTPDQLAPLMVDEGTHVYAYERAGKGYILKWTPISQTSVEEIEAELDWVNYLADHNVPVARAIPSERGAFVERIAVDDDDVLVVSHERAQGVRPEGAAFTPTLFREWGRVMGRTHTLAKDYQPSRVVIHTQAWDTPEVGRANIPFGACERNWYVSDIATALYFSLWEPHPGQDNHSFATTFLDHFLEGYQEQNQLSASWHEQLPAFLKLQEMQIYVAINEFNELGNGRDIETIPTKHRQLLRRYQDHIERDIPYLDSAYNPWSS